MPAPPIQARRLAHVQYDLFLAVSMDTWVQA